MGQENGSISVSGSELNSRILRKNKDEDVCENDGANEQELLVKKVSKLENEVGGWLLFVFFHWEFFFFFDLDAFSRVGYLLVSDLCNLGKLFRFSYSGRLQFNKNYKAH